MAVMRLNLSEAPSELIFNRECYEVEWALADLPPPSVERARCDESSATWSPSPSLCNLGGRHTLVRRMGRPERPAPSGRGGETRDRDCEAPG
jgi:hypothetical protein